MMQRSQLPMSVFMSDEPTTENIWIIGLKNHTKFLKQNSKKIFFTHTTYMNNNYLGLCCTNNIVLTVHR